MKRIMVTGANGFIGSHLVERLAERYQVVAAVREEKYRIEAVETRILPSLQSDSFWAGLFEDIDIIIHSAARVHVMRETADDPLLAFREVNSLGTKSLAEAAAAQGVKKFVFLSSIKVNGEETCGKPYTDSSVPAPVDPYGISKWEAEQYLADIQESRAMDIVVLRSPVVYGPGVRGNILKIAKIVQTSAPLPFGRVNNRRTMLSLDNLTRWVECAVETDGSLSNPILMGDPSPISTSELVNEIGVGMGQKPILIPVPVNLMRFTARLVRRPGLSQRLFEDLEVQPSFDSFPGLFEKLDDPRESLRALGASLKG